MRIAVASLVYETNSFAPGRATIDNFRRGAYVEGDDLFSVGGGMDEIAGALEVARGSGMQLIPTTVANALAGPTVTADTYQHVRERLLTGIAGVADLDGVYLRLHGAMVSEDEEDVEGDIAEAVRAIVGPDVPIAISCDLHCHFTDRMARSTSLIVGYQTCPHTDFVAAGARALRLLRDTMAGRINPTLGYRKIRMMTSSEGHDTERGPMREVMDWLHAMEEEPGVLDATLFLTQPWLDVSELGWASLVITDGDLAGAQVRADELAGQLWVRRERLLYRKVTVDEALEKVRASEASAGPFVLADGADSCSAGGAGDGVHILSAVLRAEPLGESVFIVTDAAAAQRCQSAGIGAEVDLEIGGSLTTQFHRSAPIRGRVTTLADGRYESLYPPAHASIGLTAVIRTDSGVNVVLTTSPAAQLDLQLFQRMGLDPRRMKLVQVKSAGGFREFYTPIAAACIDVATPGPADHRLPHLPFSRPVRPLFPFDESVQEPMVPR